VFSRLFYILTTFKNSQNTTGNYFLPHPVDVKHANKHEAQLLLW